MPSTNLDFNVTAKTGKAIADLKLLEEEMKEVGRQIRAALRAGDTAGARTLADTFGVMKTQAAGLNKELKATEGALNGVSRSAGLTQRSFRSFEGAILGIGKSLGAARAGLVGFAAVIGAQAVGKQIGETVDQIKNLQQTASNTNLSPAQLKTYQEAMLRAGISTEDANASLAAFNKSATDASIAAGTFGQNMKTQVMRGSEGAVSGIVTFGDKTLQVFHGAQQQIKDLSDPYKQLGVDTSKLATDFLGVRLNAALALEAMKQISAERAAGLGQQIFGPDWDKQAQALIAYANSPAWAQIRAQAGNVISPEDQARLNAYNKAWGDLQITWNNLTTESVLSLFPPLTAALQVAEGLVKNLAGSFRFLAEVARDAVNIMSSAPLPPGSIDQFPGAPPFQPGGGRDFPGGASGGYVRGPGTGTSDSILARLSNGEFVMRASAVNRWGAGFMSALNSFADGGMVMPSRAIPSFAAGGLVSATTSDGTPVTLVFPGGSFALRGDNHTVGALTREARRAGMLTGGRRAGLLQ